MKIRKWPALLLVAVIIAVLPACGRTPAGHVTEIEYRNLPEGDRAGELELLKHGDINMVPGTLTASEAMSMAGQKEINLIRSQGSYTLDCLFFNLRRSPEDDLNFRKAVAYAIDRDYITQKLLKKSVDSCDTFIPPLSRDWVQEGAKAPGFDLAKSRKFLDDAGYTLDPKTGKRIDPKTGQALSITLLSPIKTEDPVRWSIGYTMTYYLNAIGIETFHMAFPENTLHRIAMEGRDFDLLIEEVEMAAKPYGLYPLLHSSNDKAQTFAYPGLHDGVVDTELVTLWTSLDEKEAMTAAKAVQNSLAELLPYAAVCMKPDYMAVNGDWKGISAMPGEGAWNLWSALSVYPAGKLEGGVLKIAAPGGITNLNPLLEHNAAEWDMIRKIYCPLFYPDPETFENKPILAKDWTVSEWTAPNGRKGMEVVFHLKDGITWQDGEPFTSGDIKFCLDYLKENQVPLYMATADIVSEVKTPDDSTVEFYLSDRGYRHIYQLAGMTFLPQHIWKDVKDYRTFTPWTVNGALEGTTGLVGQGPFLLQSMDPEKGARLIWNKDFILNEK